MKIGGFDIDEDSSDDEYLYVDVPGLGTIQIHNTGEGIAVDILPLHVVDESLASCYATNEDLLDAQDSLNQDYQT